MQLDEARGDTMGVSAVAEDEETEAEEAAIEARAAMIVGSLE